MKKVAIQQAAFISALCPAMVCAAQNPNIIYIMTDQQTAGAMSCAGNPDLRTPNMDRLAAQGIMFTNAYSSAALSGPSRTAMFTGRYADAVGMAVNGAPMPDSLKTQTLGSLVRAAGYDCVYGGKWHIPEPAVPDDGRFGFARLHGKDDNGLAEACADYLSGEHDRPFFLVASFENPHNICEYARGQNLPYGNVGEPADIRECPGLPENFARSPYDADVTASEQTRNYDLYPTVNYSPDDWRRYRFAYFRLVEKADAEIGKILDAINANGLWENTVVIFSSDHGDGAGSHRWNQKSALFEEVVNVPLIVVLPGRKNAGAVLPQLVSGGVDFFASVCDWSGAGMPEGTVGKSFRNLAETADESAGHQDYVITETQFDCSGTRGWMVRGIRYKYVLYDRGNNREQLFDMISDRGETRNLAVERAYDGVLSAFRDVLRKWMAAQNTRPTKPKIHDVPSDEN